MSRAIETQAVKAPFDWRRLDALMEESDLDVLLVSSKHNIQYLLGGYRFFFFDVMDAIGVSRYLPILVYPRGRPEQATYIGNAMETYEAELGRFWTPNVINKTWGTQDAMREAIECIRKLDRQPRRIGIESAFLPADAYQLLKSHIEDATLADALVPLERLRAIKTMDELRLLREASERLVDSMLAVIATHGPDTTKFELADALKREENRRGLMFEYCLVTAGSSFNRAPSNQRWRAGEIASFDSGGNLDGYICDLCRMAILGDPDAELQDLLGEIDNIQHAARMAIRPGTIGKEIFAAAEKTLVNSANRERISFMAHGMGLIAHEAPRLTGSGAVPYPGYDADRPLEAGMTISIETTMHHPVRGFIKLEDTVAVTESGCEGYGDRGRGWNIGATRGP